ncbi:MAG: hypothetical protein ACREQV_06580, partial [Candidatus Binatia bacterium]
DAILAVRLAESELAGIEQTRPAGHSRMIEAERAIKRAWIALETHRYEDAIKAAHAARQSLNATD